MLDVGAHTLGWSNRVTGGDKPVPLFDMVRPGGQLGRIQPAGNFVQAAKNGTLLAVSWAIPGLSESEHAPALVRIGQAYVTNVRNALMAGPAWKSTAIFLTWDVWGGLYDHVVPRTIDGLGYGIDPKTAGRTCGRTRGGQIASVHGSTCRRQPRDRSARVRPPQPLQRRSRRAGA